MGGEAGRLDRPLSWKIDFSASAAALKTNYCNPARTEIEIIVRAVWVNFLQIIFFTLSNRSKQLLLREAAADEADWVVT